MKVLVTGGAGYIGSITVKALVQKGIDVVVFDNLSQGHKEVISTEFVQGDLLNQTDFEPLKNKNFDAVIHFAASTLAGESMQEPYKYFRNNILGGLNLVEFMKNEKIPHIVFSSTCALYGTPQIVPVTENESKKPESVYGESKLAFENILKWYGSLYGITYMNLRYFNAAGAALDGSLGENHDPETHLIPMALRAAKKNMEFNLYGTDYDTPDGTCVRDYIHVEDLAIAHIQALEKLQQGAISDSFNLGTGQGYSNKQVIDVVKKVTGVDFKVNEKERRSGDPAIIFADNSKAKTQLGFNPIHSDLETIVTTTWNWYKKQTF